VKVLRLSSHPTTSEVKTKTGIRSHKVRLPIVSLVSQAATAPTSNEVRLISNRSMSTIFHSSQTAAPRFLRDLAVSRIHRTSSPRPNVRWNVTTLLDFGASQYTAQASISLRHFSNASLRRHVRRLKRDLIPSSNASLYRWRASVYRGAGEGEANNAATPKYRLSDCRETHSLYLA
jgi:hypothetical protein